MEIKRTTTVETANYEVGDIIHFSLNDGEQVEAKAMKQEVDGMIFMLVDCLADEERMNDEDSNRGGFGSSDLRTKLNGEILDRFPSNIKDKMIAFASGDILRLPTEKEVFGVNEYGEEESDSIAQFEPMKERRNRIAFQGKNGSWEWYWLENKHNRSGTDFAFVNTNGIAYYDSASTSLGVRPAFKI